MPKYFRAGEGIEGKVILCTFKERPSFGLSKETGRMTSSIKGSPASATVQKVWEWKE